MRASLLLAMLLVGTIVVVAPVGAVEQRIEPLTPSREQRVEVIGDASGLQDVAPLDASRGQEVGSQEPTGVVKRVATTAGKIVLGVTAAAVSCGVMVASLLLI